ncbi:hypothetical protein PPERSA_04972 [Pseudocohnilembus persalinus]|uniref:NTF2 domain-containing protein n=1 Tax=Pseudocohnilembus persalinus TaxID=266149 RepID=A0A0V0QVS2_PSEPJ|nr:hypothetical protein PPERSA_04972 [Pseudocohnilembus persalinus]|eukprot:KRX06359.1 hypothetical protein PPERSA_04972 [Pseudocohnilembus persalinus]
MLQYSTPEKKFKNMEKFNEFLRQTPKVKKTSKRKSLFQNLEKISPGSKILKKCGATKKPKKSCINVFQIEQTVKKGENQEMDLSYNRGAKQKNNKNKKFVNMNEQNENQDFTFIDNNQQQQYLQKIQQQYQQKQEQQVKENKGDNFIKPVALNFDFQEDLLIQEQKLNNLQQEQQQENEEKDDDIIVDILSGDEYQLNTPQKSKPFQKYQLGLESILECEKEDRKSFCQKLNDSEYKPQNCYQLLMENNDNYNEDIIGQEGRYQQDQDQFWFEKKLNKKFEQILQVDGEISDDFNIKKQQNNFNKKLEVDQYPQKSKQQENEQNLQFIQNYQQLKQQQQYYDFIDDNCQRKNNQQQNQKRIMKADNKENEFTNFKDVKKRIVGDFLMTSSQQQQQLIQNKSLNINNHCLSQFLILYNNQCNNIIEIFNEQAKIDIIGQEQHGLAETLKALAQNFVKFDFKQEQIQKQVFQGFLVESVRGKVQGNYQGEYIMSAKIFNEKIEEMKICFHFTQ